MECNLSEAKKRRYFHHEEHEDLEEEPLQLCSTLHCLHVLHGYKPRSISSILV